MKLQATSPLRPTNPRFGTQIDYDTPTPVSFHINPDAFRLANLSVDEQHNVPAQQLLKYLLKQQKPTRPIPGGESDKVVIHITPIGDQNLTINADIGDGPKAKRGPGVVLPQDCSTPQHLSQFIQRFQQWYTQLTTQAQTTF